ncbi:MAG: hypothetical protein AAF387_20490 [Pseudomonadota bacterium]
MNSTRLWVPALFCLVLLSQSAACGELYEFTIESPSVELKIRIGDSELNADFNIPLVELDTF